MWVKDRVIIRTLPLLDTKLASADLQRAKEGSCMDTGCGRNKKSYFYLTPYSPLPPCVQPGKGAVWVKDRVMIRTLLFI